MSGQFDDQYRPPIRRKKTSNHRAEKELYQSYGVTRQELDIILLQLCELYQQNWVTVSAALYQQHKINLNSAVIKQRYCMFLDPNLRRDGFTQKEQMSIIKMFCLQGANFRDFKKIFPNRERLMFKTVLHINFRKAIFKLLDYISAEIQKLPPQELIQSGEDNIQTMVRALATEKKFEWKYNISGYKILYFFVMSEGEKLTQMPKDLVLLFYKRMNQLLKELRQERIQHYNRIDPQYHKFRLEQKKTKKRYRSKELSKSNGKSLKKGKGKSSNNQSNNGLDFDMKELAISHRRLQYNQQITQIEDLSDLQLSEFSKQSSEDEFLGSDQT